MGRVRRDTCTQPPSVVLHVGTPPPSVCVEETHRHVSLGRLGERLVRGASAEGKGVLTCHHLPCCLSAKHDAQVYGEPIFALEVGWKEITRAMRVSGSCGFSSGASFRFVFGELPCPPSPDDRNN
ncbi:uncharacterized protein RBU33_016016 isoform 2-T4 [Hipposideros larvatus]